MPLTTLVVALNCHLDVEAGPDVASRRARQLDASHAALRDRAGSLADADRARGETTGAELGRAARSRGAVHGFLPPGDADRNARSAEQLQAGNPAGIRRQPRGAPRRREVAIGNQTES